jgi:hypothetical protein
MVTKKLIEPKIEEIPETCKAKIAQSTDNVGCAAIPDNGGYKVHPVPGPDPVINETTRKKKETGNSRNDKLFSRGKAISVAPHIIGIKKFPKPEIRIGITVKKIITTA